MSKIILGIDIGTEKVKATVIDSGLRSFHVADYLELPIPQTPEAPPEEPPEPPVIEDDDERQDEEIQEPGENEPGEPAPKPKPEVDRVLAGVLRSLVEDYNLRYDELIVNAPPQYLIQRILSLPFSSRKKIDLVLGDELDELIPFDPDDLHSDYQIQEQKGAASSLLVEMIDPERFRFYLNTLRAADLEPQTVDVHANALINAASFCVSEEERTYAVVDIGAALTSIVLVREGRAAAVRTLNFGGRDITRRIADDLAVSFEEAEKLKIAKGLGSMVETGEGDGRLTAAIDGALTFLLTGLSQTFNVLESGGRQSLSRLLICGGGAQLTGLVGWLNRSLEIPTSRLAPLDGGIEHQIAAGPGKQVRMAVSLGLALRPLIKHKQRLINLCSGEFTPRKGAVQLKTKLQHLGVMSGVLALLIMILGYLNYANYSQQAKSIDSQIKQIYASVFPGQPAIQPTKQFADQIDLLQEKLQLLGGMGQTNLTALGVLREISARIPRTVIIDINKLEITPEAIRLEGLTDDFNSVDKIEAELGKFDGFVSIKKDSTTKVGGDRIKFKFIISLTEKRTATGVPR